MLTCFQFKDMNMLDHGLAVHKKYEDIWLYLQRGTCPSCHWDIPDDTFKRLMNIMPRTLNPTDAKNYCVYHDCGKHLVEYYDDKGRKHFPDHANKSADRWKECGGDELTEHLIRSDMLLHTCKGENLKALKNHSEIETLLITAWAEIHANAEMFGGIQSTSFKIKKKQLIKATNIIGIF
jgi:hypothetical protein